MWRTRGAHLTRRAKWKVVRRSFLASVTALCVMHATRSLEMTSSERGLVQRCVPRTLEWQLRMTRSDDASIKRQLSGDFHTFLNSSRIPLFTYRLVARLHQFISCVPVSGVSAWILNRWWARNGRRKNTGPHTFRWPRMMHGKSSRADDAISGHSYAEDSGGGHYCGCTIARISRGDHQMIEENRTVSFPSSFSLFSFLVSFRDRWNTSTVGYYISWEWLCHIPPTPSSTFQGSKP